MSKRSEDEVKKLIHKIAIKYRMTDKEMTELLGSPYEFALKNMQELDLESIETEDDFNNTKTNYIFPSLMRIVIDFKHLEARKIRRDYMKNLNNKRYGKRNKDSKD